MEEILKLASGICNGTREESAAREMVESFFRAHPIIQGAAFDVVILPILREMAARYDAGRYDGRNVEAYETAAACIEAIEAI